MATDASTTDDLMSGEPFGKSPSKQWQPYASLR